MKLRKVVCQMEEIHREQGQSVPRLIRRVAVAAVIENSLAGQFVENLDQLHAYGAELGVMLTETALRAWGPPETPVVVSYGKAALVGLDGETEHAAALLHPRFGAAVRAKLGNATAIMPSVAKRSAPGATLDIPLHNVANMWSFDHFDTVSLVIGDAPAAGELVIALALADGGRPLARTRRPT